MNLDNDRYFFYSGLISFGLFFSLVFLIGFRLFTVSSPMSYAMVKSNTISVSIDDAPSAAEPTQVVASAANPTAKSEEKESTKPKKAVVPEITDLFSTIKPNSESKKANETSKVLSNLNALEEKVLSSKRDSQFSEKVKTLDLAKSSVKLTAASGSTGPMVNEYHAKIQGIIYTNFHPASGTEGYAARVRISLNADGKLLSYKVVSYSGNAVFNAEVDWLKERLRQVGFPPHPTGDDSVFEIILTAKE